VRVLITTNAAVGHLLPMVPTAFALGAAGHQVRVACPASFTPFAERCGLDVMSCPEVAITSTVPPPPPADDIRGRLTWAVTQSWPSDSRPWVDALLSAARQWQPDVVVVEPVEHAGRVVAAALGVPLVVHGWGFTLPASVDERAAAGLADLYARLNATPVRPRLRVDLGLSRLQASDTPAVQRYRYVPWSVPGEELPPRNPNQPRVLVSLGTYAASGAAKEIRHAAQAVVQLGLEAVVVLGNSDRGAIDSFPPDATVVHWTDMPAAIASSDLVVHHGGAGTSWATLAAGRPAVVMPQGADQFDNAGLLAAAGAARVVEGATDLAATIGAALRDRSLAEGAQEVSAENAQLPDPHLLAADIRAACLT